MGSDGNHLPGVADLKRPPVSHPRHAPCAVARHSTTMQTGEIPPLLPFTGLIVQVNTVAVFRSREAGGQGLAIPYFFISRHIVVRLT
jgi:hypothetical protein